VGATIDQVAAAQIGRTTPCLSRLAIEEVSLSCGGGFSCAYVNTISWHSDSSSSDGNSPQVYSKLFGDGGGRTTPGSKKKTRAFWIRYRQTSLQKSLPASDKLRLDGYTDDIREIERRIQTAQSQSDSQQNAKCPGVHPGI
jgi:hypothetical protein